MIEVEIVGADIIATNTKTMKSMRLETVSVRRSDDKAAAVVAARHKWEDFLEGR